MKPDVEFNPCRSLHHVSLRAWLDIINHEVVFGLVWSDERHCGRPPHYPDCRGLSIGGHDPASVPLSRLNGEQRLPTIIVFSIAKELLNVDPS